MKKKYFLLYILLPSLLIVSLLEFSYFFLKSDYFELEWIGINGKDSLVREDVSNKFISCFNNYSRLSKTSKN